MRRMSAKDAKNSFGMLLDFECAAPVETKKAIIAKDAYAG